MTIPLYAPSTFIPLRLYSTPASVCFSSTETFVMPVQLESDSVSRAGLPDLIVMIAELEAFSLLLIGCHSGCSEHLVAR